MRRIGTKIEGRVEQALYVDAAWGVLLGQSGHPKRAPPELPIRSGVLEYPKVANLDYGRDRDVLEREFRSAIVHLSIVFRCRDVYSLNCIVRASYLGSALICTVRIVRRKTVTTESSAVLAVQT